MGLRNILNRRRKAVGPSAAAPARKSAELEAAWLELRRTAAATKVTLLRACSRNGRSWDDDPAAVRRSLPRSGAS